MVCYCSVPDGSPQGDISVLHSAHSASRTCPAKAMKPPQRWQLALDALPGAEGLVAAIDPRANRRLIDVVCPLLVNLGVLRCTAGWRQSCGVPSALEGPGPVLD